MQITDAYVHDSGGAVTAAGTASVVLRGVLRNVDFGVHSCNWDGHCGVDASYVDWGPSGPTPPTGSLVCGAVTIDPPIGTTIATGMFAVANCDGSSTPDVGFSASAQSYSSNLSGWDALCGDPLFADACSVAQLTRSCLSAAYNLAQSNSPFQLPTLETAGTTTVEVGSAYLRDTATSWVGGLLGEVAPRILNILGVVSTYQSLRTAYDQCTRRRRTGRDRFKPLGQHGFALQDPPDAVPPK